MVGGDQAPEPLRDPLLPRTTHAEGIVLNAPNAIHQAAEKTLGPIKWDDLNRGRCACPGKHLHTGKNTESDCTIFVDGVPTVYCFHTSCRSEVENVNRLLRKAIGAGKGSWTLVLPNGERLVSQPRINPMPRNAVIDRNQNDGFKKLLEDIAYKASQMKEAIFDHYQMSLPDVWEDSPTNVDLECDDFRVFLNWWRQGDNVWVGEVTDTGRDECRQNFNPNWQWMGLTHQPPQFTCGSAFVSGSTTRSNKTVAARRFLVVESDELTKEQCIAVFRYFKQRMRRTLHGIVDTGGKSLHGWFTFPASQDDEQHAKALLTALDCDPAMFKASQPVRCPGARRDNGKRQCLIWARADLPFHPPMNPNRRNELSARIDLLNAASEF